MDIDNKTQSAAIDELLTNGTVTLTSNHRDDIYNQSKDLIASLPDGTKWTRTIVQYHPNDFSFSQTYKLIK